MDFEYSHSMIVDDLNINLEIQQHVIEISQRPQVKLHVMEGGPENPQKTIIFVHGYGGWSEHWLHQIKCFKESARVIAFDLRGHSRSDKPKSDYNLELFINDFEALFNKLDVKEPFTLVGHSIGAALVSQYAELHPDSVEELVLINPSVNYAGPFFAPLAFLVPDVIFDFVLSIINKIRYAYSAPSYVMKSFYRDGLLKWDPASVLSKLTIPTLILASTTDPVFSQTDMKAVHELIPHSQFKSIATSSHMTMTRRPEIVNEEIATFLNLPSCQ